MTKLTDEAKQKYGLRTRFRLRFASFVIGLGYWIMPREYWDNLKRDEVERIADGLGLDVVDVEDDGDE